MLIPIPPHLLKELGWKEGDDVDFSIDEKGRIILKKL
jgi:bifunctional DNA-binding transcriptional regulator/antitoxin component of YhaV-PrlF toxin-antitoxin module